MRPAAELLVIEAAAIRPILEQTTARQFELPTICTGWSVRDVIAHCGAALTHIANGTLHRFTPEDNQRDVDERRSWRLRKVLGATVLQIALLLSKDFLKLVALALVVAFPLAFFGMQRWLDQFAYRVEVSVLLFIGVGLLAFVIAVVTVSYQSMRAALADPVRSLRYE